MQADGATTRAMTLVTSTTIVSVVIATTFAVRLDTLVVLVGLGANSVMAMAGLASENSDAANNVSSSQGLRKYFYQTVHH